MKTKTNERATESTLTTDIALSAGLLRYNPHTHNIVTTNMLHVYITSNYFFTL